jgi:hypothetical protein
LRVAFDASYTDPVLLFQKRFLDGLVNGSITLTFRRWAQPHVKNGGLYRVHPIGVVRVDAVSIVDEKDLNDADARAAGFTGLAEMKLWLVSKDAPLYRVELHHEGDGDRANIADDDALTPDDVAELRKRLARLDKKGPWTRQTLSLIAKHPHVAASQLAKKVKRETLPFKADVRKLKKLGLTMSFEVGYGLSPRGKKFLRLSGARAS